jgi:thiamine-monophosphate kinase
MTPEFNLIQRFFTKPTPQADLGVGDDAALIRVQPNHQLVVSTDMSVAGVHFFADTAPYLIGWKSLAVNVSDIAAMGAVPKWATLAIALPDIDEHWLAEFSRGFFACAAAFGVDLIGGDTTRGDLNISVTIMGEVPTNQALRRDGAKVGDEIWVSGELGAAAFALAKLQDKSGQFDEIDAPELERLLPSLHQPQPRVALGLALRGIASSAIDISDGLLADLGHILARSTVGAELLWTHIPHAKLQHSDLHLSHIQQMALAGGDDYELCFTAPAHFHDNILEIGKQLDVQLSCIGHIMAGEGLIVRDAAGVEIKLTQQGFDHFQTNKN